jgi:hypothetical protein
MMRTHTCDKKCCELFTQERTPFKWVVDARYPSHPLHQSSSKAGVLLHNVDNGKILLIESNSNLWGPPKGTLENGESIEDCAMREVREETGITITRDMLASSQRIKIFNQAEYFYIKTHECARAVLNINEDASGYSWIHLDCLVSMVKDGNILLTSHCKRLLSILFNIKFLVEDEFKVIK